MRLDFLDTLLQELEFVFYLGEKEGLVRIGGLHYRNAAWLEVLKHSEQNGCVKGVNKGGDYSPLKKYNWTQANSHDIFYQQPVIKNNHWEENHWQP